VILAARFTPLTSRLLHHRRSADGATVKLLVEMADGLQVEAVIMTYDTTGIYGEDSGQRRGTLCVSSEVGCAMGCTFCATGTMGLTAELTAGEIVEQLVHARAVAPIRNVVFMVSAGARRPARRAAHLLVPAAAKVS
jgi:adenine C2-methylase RlmN of 23S rRNA A2503 and tRNA A37